MPGLLPVLLTLLLLPLLQIAMEFGTTSRLAQSTAAAVQFGVDPQDALDKISKLQERLSTLEQVRSSCGWQLLIAGDYAPGLMATHVMGYVSCGGLDALCLSSHCSGLAGKQQHPATPTPPYSCTRKHACLLAKQPTHSTAHLMLCCCRLCWSSARSLGSAWCGRCPWSGSAWPAR